jgi:hypothetical protein
VVQLPIGILFDVFDLLFESEAACGGEMACSTCHGIFEQVRPLFTDLQFTECVIITTYQSRQLTHFAGIL